jgi:RNA polymerase sigma-70 factor (ECF subfamily)
MTNEKESPDQAPAAKHALTQADLAQHIPIIRNYLRKLIRPNELDDAVQNVLARALESIEKFRGDSSPRVWLLGIARNVGFEQGRRRKKAPLLASQRQDESNAELGIPDPDEAPSPETVLGRKEDQAFALQALSNLGLDDKLVLLVTYVDDLAGPEAAEILDLSFSAFRQRLSRARQSLRVELQKIQDSGDSARAAQILAAWQPALDPHGSKDDAPPKDS